ncbi:MAG: helix-turn-helix domain-containing protein, partial [Epibacterium sp.]|nr:helix-turn-helix domain-containing protein [Epibacterium sp.]NQX74315.1 helix-turn-helix domain-containing protein [Epibacterium sp.]
MTANPQMRISRQESQLARRDGSNERTKKEGDTEVVRMMKFARVPRWIIDSGTFASLSTTAKAVLPILGISLDKKSDAGRISVNRICELSGLKKSSVYSAMNELEKAGIIRRKNRESYYEFQD